MGITLVMWSMAGSSDGDSVEPPPHSGGGGGGGGDQGARVT